MLIAPVWAAIVVGLIGFFYVLPFRPHRHPGRRGLKSAASGMLGIDGELIDTRP